MVAGRCGGGRGGVGGGRGGVRGGSPRMEAGGRGRPVGEGVAVDVLRLCE